MPVNSNEGTYNPYYKKGERKIAENRMNNVVHGCLLLKLLID
jgi:hypothetical protein